jgi:hypothetical protein
LPLSGDPSFIEIHILSILSSRNLFAAPPVTSGTATFSLLSDGPSVEESLTAFVTKNCARKQLLQFLESFASGLWIDGRNTRAIP